MAAGLIRDVDPELAKALAWAWQQQGQPVSEAHFMEHGSGFTPRVAVHADLLAGLPNGLSAQGTRQHVAARFRRGAARARRAIRTKRISRIARAISSATATPTRATSFSTSKGAPLVVMGPVQYTLHQQATSRWPHSTSPFGWHSRVHFGTQLNTRRLARRRADLQVHATALGDSIDYLRGLGDYGPQRWTRQILFLKGKAAAGPNYFLFRDSFHNPDGDAAKLEPKWWFLKTAGLKDCITTTPRGLEYKGPYGAGMSVGFLQPAKIAAESRNARHGDQGYTVTCVGPVPPGQDILALLYPHKDAEKTPPYEPLADGVAKITTGEGVDYAFLRRGPFSFAQGDVAFSGVAGAVRVYPGEVHLIVAEGPGSVRFRGVTLKSASPATRVIPIGETAATRTIEVPDEKPVITFALDPREGAIVEAAPGVRRQSQASGVAYAFDGDRPIRFADNEVSFAGRRGGTGHRPPE